MVAFGTYVGIAYEVAEQKGITELQGEGTQERNQKFMSELATAYNENNHAEATESQARQFLKKNVVPP